MTQDITHRKRDRNSARLQMKMGSFEMDAEVNVTARGLVAIGFLVSAILLSVAPIVHEATRKSPPRRGDFQER